MLFFKKFVVFLTDLAVGYAFVNICVDNFVNLFVHFVELSDGAVCLNGVCDVFYVGAFG